MKIAVINFSGNVGKTTVARHLLQPRINGAIFLEIAGPKKSSRSGRLTP